MGKNIFCWICKCKVYDPNPTKKKFDGIDRYVCQYCRNKKR